MKFILLLHLLALSTAVARANVMTCPSNASLDTYINFGPTGCAVNGLVVSGFSLLAELPSGAVPVAAGAVTIDTAGPLEAPGLVFHLNQNAAGEYLALRLGFRTSQIPLQGFSASMDGGATGGGVADVVAEACAGGVFDALGCTGVPLVLIPFITESISDLFATGSFLPSYGVEFQLQFNIDGTFGTAELSSARIDFAAVPEPSGGALFLAGGALWLVAARRRAAKSRMSWRIIHAPKQ